MNIGYALVSEIQTKGAGLKSLLKALNKYDVKVIIFDPNLEEIKQWLQ